VAPGGRHPRVPAPARVFRAFEDPRLKRQWFAEGEGWHVDEFTIDFRVGGREFSRFRFGDGPEASNETIYLDIVPDHRIVIAYTMAVGDQRISSSLATMEFTAAGRGTKLIYTEQGAFFDGADQPEGREEGCRELLGKLGELLQKAV
jgi:uncharacterized protein YndB with AHSA1/START domain